MVSTEYRYEELGASCVCLHCSVDYRWDGFVDVISITIHREEKQSLLTNFVCAARRYHHPSHYNVVMKR